MKKISILHLSQVSGGGVEKYIKLFLKYSNNEKFDNYLVAPNFDNYKEYKIKKSFEFNTNQSFSIIQLLKNVLFIRKIFKEIKTTLSFLEIYLKILEFIIESPFLYISYIHYHIILYF